MNEKGQEGASFRLLIDAVLVIFILVIILGVISQIDNWRWQVSERRLFEGFYKSIDSPDGSVIVEKDIVLKHGATYSTRAFSSSIADLDHECIELDSSDSAAFYLSSDSAVLEVKNLVETNVYYKCVRGKEIGEDQCELYCTVSFGKDLANPD